VLAAIAASASWQDVRDRVPSATAEGDAMVSLNRTRLGTAVAASPFVFPQELFPVLHADEIAAGRGASTVAG